MARKSSNSSNDRVCQKCRQFEVDLTNTSDDLCATDTELKASRQVINLLQRQLEVFRQEKDSLEDIITGRVSKRVGHDSASQESSNDNHETLIQFDDKIDRPEAQHDRLLQLIHQQLYVKEEEIIKLKFHVNEISSERDRYASKLATQKEHNESLNKENEILRENLALRDKTIISLSNEVFELGQSDVAGSVQRQNAYDDSSSSLRSLKSAQRNIAKLKDTLEAYKKTNELLSNNVFRLTEKCSSLEKREIEARCQSQELEARCCQIQSKLLSLLKELGQQSSSHTGNAMSENSDQDPLNTESVRVLISRLLEDKSLEIPISWKEGNRASGSKGSSSSFEKFANSKYECDELGFYFVTMDEASNQVEVNARGEIFRMKPAQDCVDNSETLPATRLQEKNYDPIANENVRQNILRHISIDSSKTDERSWRLKWDNFIKDMDKIDLSRSKEFKNLLRSGVPQEYRCKVWKALVNLRVGKARENYGPDYYQSLLEPNRKPQNSRKTLNPASKQIELDLLRTLPNNKHFETLDSSGTVRLRRVLLAYSEHNPKVGYCQGMNRLAAVALLVLPEEEAFWCLSTIVDNIMPEGYYNNLWLAQVDSNVVMNFLSVRVPSLSEHLKRHSIDLSLFAWFLTIFVDGTPPSLFLRLWDSFLYEGDKVLFRVSLAVLKMFEDQLMKLTNSVAINNFLRSSVNAPMDVDYFFSIAFEWANPMSSRSLKARRQQNLQQIKSSLGPTHSHYPLTPSPPNSDMDEARRGSINEEQNCDDSSIISV